MTVGPRVVFVRFHTTDSPKLTPWVAHSTRVLGATTASAPAGEEAVVWQLVSANNRELARGARVHGSFADARDDAHTAVMASHDLDVHLVSEDGRGVYGWFAELSGGPAVTCARWYESDRDRRHSIAIALRSIAAASLHPGARLADPALMAGGRTGVR